MAMVPTVCACPKSLQEAVVLLLLLTRTSAQGGWRPSLCQAIPSPRQADADNTWRYVCLCVWVSGCAEIVTLCRRAGAQQYCACCCGCVTVPCLRRVGDLDGDFSESLVDGGDTAAAEDEWVATSGPGGAGTGDSDGTFCWCQQLRLGQELTWLCLASDEEDTIPGAGADSATTAGADTSSTLIICGIRVDATASIGSATAGTSAAASTAAPAPAPATAVPATATATAAAVAAPSPATASTATAAPVVASTTAATTAATTTATADAPAPQAVAPPTAPAAPSGGAASGSDEDDEYLDMATFEDDNLVHDEVCVCAWLVGTLGCVSSISLAHAVCVCVHAFVDVGAARPL